MVRKALAFTLLIFTLTSCMSLAVTFPHADVGVVSPPDGSVVPDTFTLTFYAYGEGLTFGKEVVYGFPDGPVERSRFPECSRVKAEVLVNGKVIERVEGCDTIVKSVVVSVQSETVNVEVRSGGKEERATYTVLRPYPYDVSEVSDNTVREGKSDTASLPINASRKVKVADYYLLVGWDTGTATLYSWGDTLRPLLKGLDFEIYPVGRYALVYVVLGSAWGYALVSRDTVMLYRTFSGYGSPLRPQVCSNGVAFLVKDIWITADTSGRVSTGSVSSRSYAGMGCIDGLPHIAYRSGSTLVFVGRDSFRLPLPDTGLIYDVNSFYGNGKRILYLGVHGSRSTVLVPYLWNGDGWIRTYFPVREIFLTCYPPGVGCILPFPVPLFQGGEPCVYTINPPQAMPGGFRFHERTYRVVFREE